MILKLYIEMDNAAFEDDNASAEVSRILEDAAQKMLGINREDLADYSRNLRDSNGNRVGHIEVIS